MALSAATNQPDIPSETTEDTPRLTTKPELADWLQVSVQTIDNLRARGLPWIKVGASVRFDRAEVRAWLENKTAA